ncbi:hypothetical protein CHS0354_023687 [Potamilus streckersoni]|uniref:Uncharacterized protein n=1 Tax=Potamilus streckersoni TaxID=2493646 RepID=A0AAE0SBJ6_9BIVA|nr:hypothetical protein CHS0354_023687 [Potamilus streckersoni]
MDQILRGYTDLKSMIDSVVKLNSIGTSEFLMNRSINIDALLQITYPDLFMGLCKNGTLSEFISRSGQNSSIANDLENVLCFYPEPFWQALQNRTEANILQQQPKFESMKTGLSDAQGPYLNYDASS